MTRFLVTGAGGQLGSDLVAALSGREFVALPHSELNLTDHTVTWATLGYAAPDVVINAAAFTDVDGAETDEAAAASINAEAPGVLAAGCAAAGAVLIHVSTDYVFGGRPGVDRPYEVTDPVAPLGVYGRTKEAGERAVRAAHGEHYVVRTSWLYGGSGRNFVRTMTELERQGEVVDVVDDQHGSPTFSADLARGLVQLADSKAPFGTYHCTGAGTTTWCGLARAVFAELGADPERVRPVSTADVPRPAPRPAYSVLSDAAWVAAGLSPLRPWQQALPDALARYRVGP